MPGRPLRVLMTADAVGGVWQYATDLAEGLAPLGVETVIAVLGPSPDRSQLDAACAATIRDTGLPLDWLSDVEATRAAAAEIAGLARCEDVDLVHLNSPALAGLESFPVPVLGAAHGCLSTWWQAARPGQPLDPAFSWHETAMARGLRACDRVLAPSASFAETLRARYRLPSRPDVVHNGRRDPAEAIAASPQHDCAFTAGRLWDEVKDAATLDRAAAMLAVPFYAAGDARAPQGSAVQLQHLHLLGKLNAAQMEQRLASRPVFVSAALFEPFGLAVLEAAARGCPLVLSDIATFRELWSGAAMLVPPGDAEAFACAISECVGDLALRQALGEAARMRAQRYSLDHMARATNDHYRALLRARLAA